MASLFKRSCAALTWSADGSCRGVLLRGTKNRCRVLNAWRAGTNADEPVSSRLAQGARRLGVDENTIVLLGGSGLDYGMVDLKFPSLPPAELHSAISFALAKHAPINAEKLVWGYRIIRDRKQDGLDIRVVFLRDSEWGKWLEECSGFGRGVDLIIPPAAVLDPSLSETDVYLNGSGDGYVCFHAKPDGTREAMPAPAGVKAGFGIGESPISLPGLDLGKQLGRMSGDEQREFVPALLLSLHGVGRSLASDRRTWVPVPYQLRPQRNRYSRLMAAMLILALAGVAGMFGFREYTAANDHYTALKEQREDLEAQVKRLKDLGDPRETIRALADELGEVRVDRPSLGAALIELSQLTDEALWVTSFTWTDGKIEAQFSTEDQQADIRSKVESSPIFEGVIQTRRQIGANGVTAIHLAMYVTYTGDGVPITMPPEDTGATPTDDDGTPPTEGTDTGPGDGTTTTPGDGAHGTAPTPDTPPPEETQTPDAKADDSQASVEDTDVAEDPPPAAKRDDGDSAVPGTPPTPPETPGATPSLAPPPPPPPIDPALLEEIRKRQKARRAAEVIRKAGATPPPAPGGAANDEE